LLDTDYPNFGDQLNNAVDQQKRIAVRQEFLYCQGIEDCFHHEHCRLPIVDWFISTECVSNRHLAMCTRQWHYYGVGEVAAVTGFLLLKSAINARVMFVLSAK